MSTPFYSSATFWTGAGVAVAIVVPVVLWRLGAPRRLLAYDLPVSTPMLSRQWPLPPDDAPVQVLIAGEPVDNAHVVVLQFANRSRRDIRSSDFDQRKPLAFDLGAKVIALSEEEAPVSVREQVQFTETGISYGPALIRAGQEVRLTLLTVGPPHLTCDSPLVNVKVTERNLDSRGWAPGWLRACFVAAVLGTLAAWIRTNSGWALVAAMAAISVIAGVIIVQDVLRPRP